MILETRRVRTSAGEVALVDRGDGPAVVLLHGFPTSSFLWREFVPPLAARMRVVAPDLPGYGDSDKPEDAPLHLGAQAGYVRELLDGLGIEEFAVVGHDLGGGIAQLLALEGGVRALVLMDALAFDVWPVQGVRMVQGASPDQESPEFVRDVVDVGLDLGILRKERLTEEIREAYRAPFSGEAGARAFFRAVRALDGVGLSGREEELGRLDIPVMVLWGEEDPFLPVEVAERLADLFSDSVLALLPGCSHFLPEEAPATVVPIVYEYLRSRYLAEAHAHVPHGPASMGLRRPGPG